MQPTEDWEGRPECGNSLRNSVRRPLQSCRCHPPHVQIRDVKQLTYSPAGLVHDRGVRHVACCIDPESIDAADLEQHNFKVAENLCCRSQFLVVIGNYPDSPCSMKRPQRSSFIPGRRSTCGVRARSVPLAPRRTLKNSLGQRCTAVCFDGLACNECNATFDREAVPFHGLRIGPIDRRIGAVTGVAKRGASKHETLFHHRGENGWSKREQRKPSSSSQTPSGRNAS
jgi:hypothetical protein